MNMRPNAQLEEMTVGGKGAPFSQGSGEDG